MRFQNLFLALLLISWTPAFATVKTPAKSVCSIVASGNEVQWAKNLNKFLRSNPRHFFESGAVKAWLKESPELASFLGLVIGDGHPNNVGPDYVKGDRQWIPLDLDDVGFGPVLLGLVKTMVLTKSATKEVKYTDMIKSFLKGMRGGNESAPKAIRKLLKVDEEDFLDELEEYAEDKSEGNQIEQRDDYEEMTRAEHAVVKVAIEELFPKTKFLSGMKMKKDSGGSAAAYRYRILARVDGRKMILDVKEILGGNLFNGLGSQDPAEHLAELLPIIFKGDTAYRKIAKLKVGGKTRAFLLRIKVEVDAVVEQPPEDVEEFNEVVLYNLFVQGQMSQLSDTQREQLAALFKRNPEKLIENLKALAKAYRAEAKADLNELDEPEEDEE